MEHLRRKCRTQSTSLLVPMGGEMAYRYQENIMGDMLDAIRDFRIRLAERFDDPIPDDIHLTYHEIEARGVRRSAQELAEELVEAAKGQQTVAAADSDDDEADDDENSAAVEAKEPADENVDDVEVSDNAADDDDGEAENDEDDDEKARRSGFARGLLFVGLVLGAGHVFAIAPGHIDLGFVFEGGLSEHHHLVASLDALLHLDGAPVGDTGLDPDPVGLSVADGERVGARLLIEQRALGD